MKLKGSSVLMGTGQSRTVYEGANSCCDLQSRLSFISLESTKTKLAYYGQKPLLQDLNWVENQETSLCQSDIGPLVMFHFN